MMERILAALGRIPADKARHALLGAAIAFILSPIHPALALAVVIAAGSWKEWVYDKARPKDHTVDARDFYATVAGGLMVILPATYHFLAH